MASSAVLGRLGALADRYALPDGASARLATLLDLVAEEPTSITSVRDPDRGVDLHVADSLVALDLDVLREAAVLADLGAGGGFPGLPLAVALPQARAILVESVGRKCAFLQRAVRELGLDNVVVVNARAEAWPAGIGASDVVTARALAPLGVLVEYASPLLRAGGSLVAWKGHREPREEADAAVAADVLGMERPAPYPVEPFPGADVRTLYLSMKVGATPAGYPRRAGMARKRPFTASSGR